jgi:hypothetical protein
MKKRPGSCISSHDPRKEFGTFSDSAIFGTVEESLRCAVAVFVLSRVAGYDSATTKCPVAFMGGHGSVTSVIMF